MSCSIDSGFSQPCEYALGGVEVLWLQNHSNLPQSGVTYATNGQVTGATLSSGSWFRYEVTKNSSVFSEEVQVGENKFPLQTLSFSLKKTADVQADLNQVKKLSLGKIVAIVKTRGGDYRLAGWLNPLEATVSTNSTGQAESDSVNYTFTFTAGQVDHAPTISTAVTASLPTS